MRLTADIETVSFFIVAMEICILIHNSLNIFFKFPFIGLLKVEILIGNLLRNGMIRIYRKA